MPFLADKRYIEIVFDPGKWSKEIGQGGVVTWTSTAPDAGVTITKIDGGNQPHTNCPPGSKITTTGGTAVVEIL